MYKLLLAQFFILNQSLSCCKLSLAVKVSESLFLTPVEGWTWGNLQLSKADVVPEIQGAAPPVTASGGVPRHLGPGQQNM